MHATLGTILVLLLFFMKNKLIFLLPVLLLSVFVLPAYATTQHMVTHTENNTTVNNTNNNVNTNNNNSSATSNVSQTVSQTTGDINVAVANQAVPQSMQPVAQIVTVAPPSTPTQLPQTGTPFTTILTLASLFLLGLTIRKIAK